MQVLFARVALRKQHLHSCIGKTTGLTATIFDKLSPTYPTVDKQPN